MLDGAQRNFVQGEADEKRPLLCNDCNRNENTKWKYATQQNWVSQSKIQNRGFEARGPILRSRPTSRELKSSRLIPRDHQDHQYIAAWSKGSIAWNM